MNERVREILDFWFGTPAAPSEMSRWFISNPAFDDEIRVRFGDDVERASLGELDAWGAAPKDDPESALALVILLDQFSRNLFRGTERAFLQDARALAISEHTQAVGGDLRLSSMQRYVLLLPMMHSEDLDVQRRGVAAYRKLLEDAIARGEPERIVGGLRNALDYAERHEHIVARFGRFPHRNVVLGRVSTPEESAFLLEPGSSF
jgi:uncharacterized protein (DUF924 family)